MLVIMDTKECESMAWKLAEELTEHEEHRERETHPRPLMADEFTCGTCFTVRHKTSAVMSLDNIKHCSECFEL